MDVWMNPNISKNMLELRAKVQSAQPTDFVARRKPKIQAQNTIFQTILCRPFHFSIMYIVRLQFMTLHLQKECFPSYIYIK